MQCKASDRPIDIRCQTLGTEVARTEDTAVTEFLPRWREFGIDWHSCHPILATGPGKGRSNPAAQGSESASFTPGNFLTHCLAIITF